MARNTRTEQTTLINTNLPTPPDANSPITAVNHREVVNDFNDSVFFLEDDTVENGLTLDLAVTDGDPSTIKLGGDLTENTTIGGNFNLRISEGLSCGTGALSSIGSANFRVGENTTTKAHLNLNPNTGVNKTTPISGDMWFNGTNLNFHDGTTTTDLLAGASLSGTDNFIPKFNLAGDNIEDSKLITTDLGDNTVDRVHSIKFEGINTSVSTTAYTTFNLFGQDAQTSQTGLLSRYRPSDNYGDVNYESRVQARNTAYVGSRFGGIFSGSGVHEICEFVVNNKQLFSSRYRQSNGDYSLIFDTDTPLFSGGGDQNFAGITMRGKEAHMTIGRHLYRPAGTNVLLSLINSGLNGFTSRPHVLISGGYDETATAPSDNSIWLSSNSNRLEVREGGTNYKLVTRDIFDLTDTIDPGVGTWSLQYNGSTQEFSWV